MRTLESYRNVEFVGVAQLAEAAAAILQNPEFAHERNLEPVSLNERTIRYYNSKGINLLPPAEMRRTNRGTSTVFTYQHLLTLFVIKNLQSQGTPIRIIKRILEGKSIGELEALTNETVRFSYDEQEGVQAQAMGEPVYNIRDPRDIADILASPLNDAVDQVGNFRAEPFPSENMLSASDETVPEPLKLPMGSTNVDAQMWERHPVSDGIEVHVSQVAELDEPRKQRLLEVIKKWLTSNSMF
ncbi:MAG: MerR family transcriptional regulator [Pyrinomonadaceae bacterium]